MATRTRRSLVWLLGAGAIATLAITMARGQDAAVRDATLAYGLVAQLLFAIATWAILRSGTAVGHTAARWVAIDVARFLAAAGTFVFVVWSVGITIATAGAALVDPRSIALLVVAFLAALAGAILEVPPIRIGRAASKGGPAAPPRFVYRTRGGRVEGGAGEPLVTGLAGAERLTDVERAIDSRGWREGQEPRPRDLRAALDRWGDLEGSGDL